MIHPNVVSHRVFKVDIDLQFSDVSSHMSPSEVKQFLVDVAPVHDFYDCVESIKLFLENNEFTIDEFHPSPNLGSLSYYVSCHRTDRETDKTIECEFYIRIADHDLQSRSDQRRKHRAKNVTGPQIEQQTGKKIMNSRFPFIKYDNKKYSSFDDFLLAVTSDLLNWEKRFGF